MQVLQDGAEEELMRIVRRYHNDYAMSITQNTLCRYIGNVFKDVTYKVYSHGTVRQGHKVFQMEHTHGCALVGR